MKWWDQLPWSSFSEYWALSQFFHSPLSVLYFLLIFWICNIIIIPPYILHIFTPVQSKFKYIPFQEIRVWVYLYVFGLVSSFSIYLMWGKGSTGHGTTDWFQIGKRVHQGCILSSCLFNLSAEYIMRNAGLEEAHQASLSITNFQSLLKLMFITSAMPSNHLILCHPFLLLPSIFSSIRVFSNELALRIRWSKY